MNRDRQGSTERPDIDAHWRPNKGPQEQFFRSDVHEVLYGGEAGGGKSAALTALPLRWCHLPGFLSLTLRRTFPQTRDLKSKSKDLYRRVFPGLRPIKSEGFTWTFPSGAEAVYGHCQNEDSYEIYDGLEINLLNFDELTHFTWEQYTRISARVRTSRPGYPTLIRATSNPGGEGHEWVFERWGPWLNPEHPHRVAPGEVLWVRTEEDGTETFHEEQVPGSLSRTFIPAGRHDNPHLDATTYEAQLNTLDPVRKAQLKEGNWLVRPAAGLFFRREWVEIIPPEVLPDGIRWVRYWDLAATAKSTADWTVGVKIGKLGSTIYVEDVIRVQENPGVIKRLIRSTAELDGHACSIGIPQDPGQAGKSQVTDLVQYLEGFTVLSETESGDKGTRFGPFSSQAEHGNVRLVRGDWNKAYINELEAFPSKGVPDDQVDATSGGYKRLTSGAANFLDAMAAFEARQ